jgi:very-short-patch-repair endonuclease
VVRNGKLGKVKREIIPYNPRLKEFARKLRKTMTFSEVKVWNALKNGQLMGYDFDRQRPIGNYIVDYYCKDLLLALEIDGITHHDEKVMYKDRIRQKELEALGVTFLRFDALLCINKVAAVVREIAQWIEEYERKNGVNENVMRKREKLKSPGLRKRVRR